MRISVTTLEQFRRVLQTEYAKESDLIAQIKREPFAPTWQMQAGSAWHSVIEDPTLYQCIEPRLSGEPDIFYECDGYSFSADAVWHAINVIGPGKWEVKATQVYDVLGVPVTMVAMCDHISGKRIQDNKTKFSPSDPRDYEPSLQWRWYLEIFQASMFQYNLWSFADPKTEEGREGGYCELKDVMQFRFFPYVGMRDECMEWLGRFVDWVYSRGLAKYLDRN